MRPGQLRALLRDLRAAGVSEFSETTKTGTTVTLKLAGARQAETADRKPAPKTAPVDPESRRSYEAFLQSVNVTESQAAEVLKHVQ